ncbi:unnamed protein product [Orchesella dallaii]|uniref:Uncharacterized protein n=1 Tax=Orchesella dallaii TaxID=48710 RepID=A0ABP1R0P3_9HEXA
MRWALVFLLVSVLVSQLLAQDSTEDSPAPKRVLKKYRVRRPVVVDDQGNVVRAGAPRLRRVRVKQPRPTVETAQLRANPPQQVTVSSSTSSQQSTQPIVISSNPPRVRTQQREQQRENQREQQREQREQQRENQREQERETQREQQRESQREKQRELQRERAEQQVQQQQQIIATTAAPIARPQPQQQPQIQHQTRVNIPQQQQQQPRQLFVQQPKARFPEQVYEEAPQVIEQIRTVPTYRQATPSASRQALLANVNYKTRPSNSVQALDDEDEDGQKVGTIRNYSHINEDGSFTFGYEAADGSFKEETRGIDCVVRGKYGYVDPDGVRREFEYVSGNPCDPNAPKEEDQLEEDEDDEISAPPPRPLLRRIRPQISDDQLQGLQQVREEALSDDQLNQFGRPAPRQRVTRPQQQPSPRPRIRITTAPPTLRPQTESPALIIRERPVSIRPQVYQEPSQSLDSDRGGRAFNFDSEVQRLSQISRPISQPQPLYEQPLQVVQRHPTPTIATQPSRQVFGGQAFRQSGGTLASPTAPSPTSSSGSQRNPNFGRYRTELVYDPASGQYTSVVVQAMPHSNQEFELTQKLRAFVEPQRSNQVQISNFGQPQIQYFGNPAQPSPQGPTQASPPRHQLQHNQIDQFLARNAYSQQNQEAAQQRQQQQQLTNYNTFEPPHHQLRPNPGPSEAPQQQLAPQQVHHVPQQQQQQQLQQQYEPQQQTVRQFQYPSQTIDDGRNPANGQIDAFLRSLNINI